MARPLADSAPTEQHQLTQLGLGGTAGWRDEHRGLVGKECSAVLSEGQVALVPVDL